MAALDDQIRDRVGRLLDSLRGRLESELGSCQDELIRTAQDASATIAAEAAEHATAEARREAERHLTEVREAAAREADEQRTRLTAEIESVQRRFDESQRQVEDSQKASSSAREQIETLNEELDEARKQLDATRDDVEATLRDIQASQRDLETSRRDIEASRRDAETARAEVNRLLGELRNHDERSVQTRRLPDAVRAMDEAVTVAEVLETLAVWGGREAGRAAVFLVKGNRLRDWRTVGFDFPSDGPRLDIDVSESGPMAEAIQSGKGVCPRAQGCAPEFARTDEAREPAAWPVSVGGAVVAVLYADSAVADKSGEPYWPAFLDVLARHAGRVLEAITVRQAAGLMTGTATSLASRSGASSVSRQSTGSIQ